METTLLTLGVLLVLVGLIGQVKAKEIEVGTKSPFVRIILGLMGVVFVYMSLSKGFLPSLPIPPSSVPTSLSPAHTPTPSPTETLTPTIPPCGGCVPTPTPECFYRTTEGHGGQVSIPVSPTLRVREIIISMTRKNSTDPAWGYSLFEVEAYGPDIGNYLVKAGTTARASTTQQKFVAENAIDGKPKDPSRWSSDPAALGPQWLMIDLPDAQLVNRIDLYWERAYAVAYDVCVIHD
jgi:hypothetical protein